MGRPTLTENEAIVNHLWLDDCLSIREIEARTEIPRSTISDIINRYREKEPQIDDYRELSKSLKQSDCSIMDAIRLVNFRRTLDRLGISEQQLINSVNLLESHKEDAPGVLDAGVHLRSIEEQTGKSYLQLVIDAEAKSKFLGKYEEYVSKLRDEDQKLRQSLPELQGLEKIQKRLDTRNVSITELDKFIEDSQKLVQLGFTLDVARYLADRLAEIDNDPAKASEKLTSVLKQYDSLDAAILERRRLWKSFEELVKTASTQVNEVTNIADEVTKKVNYARKNHLTNIAELKVEIDKLEKKEHAIDERLAIKEAELHLTQAVTILLNDPKSFSDSEFKILEDLIMRIKSDRLAGFYRSAEIDQSILRDFIARGMLRLPGLNAVARQVYDRLEGRYNSALEENKLLSGSLNAASDKAKKVDSYIQSIRIVKDLMFPSDQSEIFREFECTNCHKMTTLNRVGFEKDLRRVGYFVFKCETCSKEIKADMEYLLENFANHPQWIP